MHATTGHFVVKVHVISSQRCQDAKTNTHAGDREPASHSQIKMVATRFRGVPLMAVIFNRLSIHLDRRSDDSVQRRRHDVLFCSC